MGSSFSLVLYRTGSRAAGGGRGAAFPEAHRLDGMLSNYRAESEWSPSIARRPRIPST